MAKDVCRKKFPPVIYGATLKEIEDTIGRVIRRVFVDADGFLRSFVNGRTMTPYRLADLPGHNFGRGTFMERSSMPPELKPVFMNYEDSEMATGDYLCALIEKRRATGDRRTLAEAGRTYRAIRRLCWNSFAANRSAHYRRGWLPKPYAGIRKVAEIFECSVDQYMMVTYALEKYRNEMADRIERREIEDIIRAFADWWIDHDFTSNYGGNCCWWLKSNQAHSTAYFLYLTALARTFSRKDKYQEAFKHCLKFRQAMIHGKGDYAHSCSMAIESAARLCELEPGGRYFWRRAMLRQIGYSLEALNEDGSLNNPYARVQEGVRVASALAAVHRMFPERSFGKQVFPLLRKYDRRERFYHVSRGPNHIYPALRKPNCINGFSAQCHATWLRAYWMMQ